MSYLGVVLALAFLSCTLADEGCPDASQISPCTCDGEGISCVSATSLDQIRKAFQGTFKYGGVLSVWIQGTSITSIPAGLFGTVKAQSFYLEVNKISSVDQSAFDNTKAYIRALSFFSNQLTSVPFTSLNIFPQLQVLNLGRNKIPIIRDNAFYHNGLASLILAGNVIASIGANAFKNLPNLQRLELSSNPITILGAYSIALSSSAPGLQINLADNRISSVSDTAFDGASPQVLFLTSNRLSSLKSGAFSLLLNRISQHGGVIEVSANPLSCKGCDFKWIVDNKYVLSQMIIGFRCPDGKGIDQLTSQNIGC